MSYNYKFINKNDFLEATRGGFDFYNFVMRKQGVNLRIKESNNSLKNPFYNDTKGSLSINFQNDEYLFNDFGDTRFRGDVLNFAGFYYNLNTDTELQKILINCCKDLGISNLLVVNNSFGIKAVIERDKFLEFEKEYWVNFGISIEILNKYDAVSVDYLLLSKKNYKLFSNKKNPIFAFKELECSKIYQPLSKKYKHQWFPKKKIDTPFGYKQLENQGDLLIIAAGEKDVLSLASQGYSAISLNSETQTNIDKDLLNDLSSRFRTIAVLYDIDETGKKAAKQLSEKYAFSIIELPNELLELGFGKDVSDYFKAVVSGANQELFSVEKFRELVEKSISIKQKLNAVPDLEYSNLPDFFQDLLSKFNSKQERDLILLSSLAVLSACIPNYYAIFDNFIIYPNLYLFVVGNPASGKGVIGFSRILVEALDNEIFEANKRMQELQQKDNDIKNISCPRKIILPANSSSTGFFELLHKNNGNGLIIETEADTLSYIFKKDYGDYSDGFRKAFHHEPISFYRRTQKEYICIQKPKLSVVLSGTPAQVFTLIQNNEDGLFSRFIFFLIIQKAEFKNVFASSENNIEDFFMKRVY
ncbi:MAG TPA: DUF3987 domain-containing protein [Candidatus Kapabacteria bacterium]|nr:DUF3987 domain-containing protein [Candidatus Kapabacteria bacterium]HPO63383.1 DUF3987 domain-containing protein [Candidatus Kapabacteria bacterium]